MSENPKGQVVPLERAGRTGWLGLLAEDPAASPLCHPDLAHPPETLVYCKGAGERTLALGVLAPRRIAVTATVPLRKHLVLRGHRLLGDQVLGGRGSGIADDFVTTIADFLASGASQAVLIEDLEERSALWNAARRLAGEQRLTLHEPSPPQAHWFIDLPAQASDYWAEQFNAKRRGNLKRAAASKKFVHHIARATAPADVAAFVRDAESVSRRSWQGKRLGVRVHEGRTAELTALAQAGVLRAYVLHHEGKPVSFLLGLQQGQRFLTDEIAYDADMAEHSPGTVLLYRVIEDLIAELTPRTIDFGAGHADYKSLFGNRQAPSGPLVLVARRPLPQLVLGLARVASRADRAMRDLLKRSGLYEKVRRAYRNKPE